MSSWIEGFPAYKPWARCSRPFARVPADRTFPLLGKDSDFVGVLLETADESS
jgi:hypothetical protein